MEADLLYRLWGKTNEREKDFSAEKWKYHPAICHMIDVGYVAETWLVLNPKIMNRFCELSPEIEPEQLRRIIVTITALHDLGKVHRSFQAKSEQGWIVGYGTTGLQRPDSGGRGFDHGLGSARIMRELIAGGHHQWHPWRSIINAVAAHHGKFYDSASLLSDNTMLYLPMKSGEYVIAEEALRVLSDLFRLPTELPPPPPHASFQMLIAGFCSVADWFGSNSDVFQFHPVNNRGETVMYLAALREQRLAETMLCDAGVVPNLTTSTITYASLFDYLKPPAKLRPLQERAMQIPFGERSGPEMVIVEAPMGMGKTELALFLTAMAVHHDTGEGLYFALPTQASANAILDRITGFAERISQGEISLALAHGSRRFNKNFQGLQQNYWRRRKEFERSRERGSVYGGEEDAPSEVIAPSWLGSSKRSLLATIGVGTIDQAMLGAISAKHGFVRLFALSGKIVVFDEIHAYDTYMNVVILHLLKWLHALGAKVLLLSATLPRKLRKQLLEAYGGDTKDEQGDLATDPYPQILHLYDGVCTPYRIEDGQVDERQHKDIHISTYQVPEEERTQRGAELVVELARDGGCVAWIRNTVREAQDAWRVIRSLKARDDEAEVVLLHARFTRSDRNRIEEQLVDVLGKNAGSRRPRKLIVIATQVIEQSVDLDFDAMVSDLAPVDLLLQRAGRLWRHDIRTVEERQGHTQAILHVLLPSEEELRALSFGSSAYVYDAETLARSARIVQDHSQWCLPDACRALVARLYDCDGDWTVDRLAVDAERLETVRKRQHELCQVMEGNARRILMSDPDGRQLQMKTAFRDDDKGGSIALTTRYGGSSATIILLARTAAGVRLIGMPELSLETLPDAEEYRAIVELEEGIALSAVSFPWYEAMKKDHTLDAAEPLVKWWEERNPYDNKAFVLVEGDGSIDQPQFSGRYHRDSDGNAHEGLVIEKKKGREEKETITYEHI